MIKDAILHVQHVLAAAVYGPTWYTRLRLVSVQITEMPHGDERGWHEDNWEAAANDLVHEFGDARSCNTDARFMGSVCA